MERRKGAGILGRVATEAVPPRRDRGWVRWIRLPGLEVQDGDGGAVLQAYPEAKRALIAQGRPAEQVEAMPAVQVAALHTFREYEKYRDDFFKWTSLPFYQGYHGMDECMADNRSRTEGRFLFKLFTMLIPAVRSCGLSLALSERRLDAIQCIEAIRLHAALHGKLPTRLEEITDAPVPLDSGTGKPFVVSRKRESRDAHGAVPDRRSGRSTAPDQLRIEFDPLTSNGRTGQCGNPGQAQQQPAINKGETS